MLYVVSTPIGNLKDLSPRALETLQSVDLIAAEDTRHTLKLLNHYGVRKPLTSLHEHNEQGKGEQLVERMQVEGISVALVTDAGTPAISDPGALFVALAARADIQVLAVPGPSALIAALSVSGIINPSFSFFGFPPRGKKELQEMLRSLPGRAQTAIFHESPHRVDRLMQEALACFGDVHGSLSCDLTKLHEMTIRGPLSNLLSAFAANEKARKGEYVLVLDLAGLAPQDKESPGKPSPEALLLERLLDGMDMRQAMEQVQALGIKKNEVYAASLRLKAWRNGGS